MTAAKRTKLYLVAADVGTLALAGFLAAAALHWPDIVRGFFVGVLLVVVLALFWRGLRDEYLEQLWNRGTSAAFLAVVAWFLFGPFLEGLFDGLSGSDAQLDLPQTGAAIFAIGGFYLGFQIARIRSAL